MFASGTNIGTVHTATVLSVIHNIYVYYYYYSIIERHIYYVISISVLHAIQWRCYSSSTFTLSTNNGMRSLASGCYVICVRFGSLRLLFQPLRHGKEIWYMVFPLECADSLASGGNMN
jgi:hypothetical protein